MKKVFVSLCMASVLMGLSSCASTKNAATLSSISGEWNIIEVNGTAVVPAPGQEFPYIGFDTKTGKVFGNSGCNRMMGSFDVNAKPGTIDLGALASTRMACPGVFIINLESAVNQIATRIAVQALFCNIKFNERLLLHSVGNSLARSLTNYPLSFQIRQLGNGFFLLQHDYGTIGSTA